MGVAVMLGLPAVTPAVDTWFDDFNDGDATDGVPETWLPHPAIPGDYNAMSGDFIFTPGNDSNDDDSMAATIQDQSFTDVSVRTRAQTIIYDGNVGAVARFDVNTVSGYVGLIDSSDNLILMRVEFGQPVEDFSFQEEFPGLNALQDVIFQLDVFGDTVSVSAWYPGEPQPLAQMVQTDPNAVASGTAGLIYNEDDEDFDPFLPAGVFRWATAASARIIDGDVNFDGSVNSLDVAPFVNAVISGVYAAPADINGDGTVNGLDVDPFVDAVIGGSVEARGVPEPSTGILAFVGLAAGVLMRRRLRGA